MPRKGKVPKRDILPDPKFHSKLVSKFVHGIMWEGKKSTAETILYDALEIVGKKLNEESLEIAREMGFNIFCTDLTMYETCGILYQKGLKGISCH